MIKSHLGPLRQILWRFKVFVYQNPGPGGQAAGPVVVVVALDQGLAAVLLLHPVAVEAAGGVVVEAGLELALGAGDFLALGVAQQLGRGEGWASRSACSAARRLEYPPGAMRSFCSSNTCAGAVNPHGKQHR